MGYVWNKSDWRRLSNAIGLLGLMCIPFSLQAHEGPAYGQGLYIDAEGNSIGYHANYGVVLFENDKHVWAAEELLPGAPHWFAVDDGAALVAGTSFGIYRSQDGGCNWQRASLSQTGNNVYASAQLAIDPSDRNHLWTVTHTTLATGTGAPVDALYESTDRGGTWHVAGLSSSTRRYDGVHYLAPFQTFLVLGSIDDDASANDGKPVLIYGSEQSSWTESELDLNGYTGLTLLKINAGDSAALTAHEIYLGALVEGTPVLLYSDDGGANFVEVQRFAESNASAQPATKIQSMLHFEGRDYIFLLPNFLFERSETSAFVDTGFESYGAFIADVLDSNNAISSQLWRATLVDVETRLQFNDVIQGPYQQRNDQGAWQNVYGINSLCPRVCPRDNPAQIANADFNAMAWTALATNFGLSAERSCDDEVIPNPPTEEEGVSDSCTQVNSHGCFLLIFCLLLMCRGHMSVWCGV